MTDEIPFNAGEVAERLLAWYGREGRELPWRQTRDPYHIWLSEIMLQQTTVAAVIPYYQAFLQRFPDVATLAAAPVEAVIEQWAGLGYYRRARNLHAAARMVVERFAGRFPAELQQLQELPGIGRSTAGAILSIAFDTAAPILDGNVRRVLCRLCALQLPARSTAAEKLLWSWAEILTPVDRPNDYAQAIMDLGATVCLPRGPLCGVCPLAGLCLANARGLEEELPLSAPKKAIPTVRQVVLAICSDGRYLVLRRPLDGMLGGLWEFPTAQILEGESPLGAAARLATEQGGRLCGEAVGEGRHVYSHFRLESVLFAAEGVPERTAEGQESRLVSRAELEALPLHGAHKKLVPLLDGCRAALK